MNKISVATNEYIKTLTEKRDNAKNSYEKARYNKMIQEELDGICSHCHREYGMVEHCSEPDCPECIKSAYDKGYEDGKDYWKNNIKKMNYTKLFKKENWVFSFNNEWKQIIGKYNWYSFTFIHVYFENETWTGGVEFHFMFMGLGFYIRYNYDFEGSKVGKVVIDYEKKLKRKKK